MEIAQAKIDSKVRKQLKVLEGAIPPIVTPGRQCDEPFSCEFFAHCNAPVPADHVSYLPGMWGTKVDDLAAMGISSISDIPDDYPLSERQRTACTAVKDDTAWFGPDLKEDLSQLRYPLCFMDFETVYPALPRFAGMRPYDHIPFQWSVHRQESSRAPLKHHEFLAEDDGDPRPAFIESLCRALMGAKTIVVYNQSFESGRLADLARRHPEYGAAIRGIQTKLFDLLPLIRRNVYHPAFEGSYSLKKVLPALLPEMTYAGMRVADGGDAGIAWEQMIAPRLADAERQRLRSALLEYCGQDTLGLAVLVKYLKELAVGKIKDDATQPLAVC